MLICIIQVVIPPTKRARARSLFAPKWTSTEFQRQVSKIACLRVNNQIRGTCLLLSCIQLHRPSHWKFVVILRTENLKIVEITHVIHMSIVARLLRSALHEHGIIWNSFG